MPSRIFFLAVITFLLSSVISAQNNSDLCRYVDPFIGTGGFGHTFPGATLPFGMVQLSPDTYVHGWDYCAGYQVADSLLMGFSHTHLSGTGCADYGDILFMPTTGVINLTPGSKDKPGSGYHSRFKHENEKAEPGYYSVYLDDYKINAELTATLRTGLHKYTYPASKEANVIIDLEHGLEDKCLNAAIKFIGNNEIEGFRRSKGWNNDHTVYFVAKFSKSFSSHGFSEKDKTNTTALKAQSDNLKAYVRFTTQENETILIKVGISHTGIADARKNLNAEAKGWAFDKTREAARMAWEKEISKISVDGGTKEQLTCFYTALYHCMMDPNVFSNADGTFMGMDSLIHKEKKFTVYTVFSLWDTFRSLHPLLSIIDHKRTEDFIKSLYTKYKESGALPIWELAAWETNCMIGYHSVPVIVDAYMKGILKDEPLKYLEAMKQSADNNPFGVKSYIESGYVQAGKFSESVSKTLEYAYDDWCIAVMAKALGRKNDYERYGKRALYYRNLFDGSTGFMRGKKDGVFVTPFNPFGESTCYTEASAWQYNLFVPHDLNGLMNLFGNKEQFTKRLDELFSSSQAPDLMQQQNRPGMIGQYAHDNEPSHNLAYLYNFVGQDWKTQELVRKIMDEFYSVKHDGLVGNDDCGQTSAWYVLSALGIFPVCPGTNEYMIGTPLFKKAVIHLENGKDIVINAPATSQENKYVNSLSLNGKPLNRSYITHEEIKDGAVLAFEMSGKPNKSRSTGFTSLPYSFSNDKLVSPAFVLPDDNQFLDSLTISLGCRTEGAEIYYTTNGGTPDKSSTRYTAPFTIKENTVIQAAAFKDGFASAAAVKTSFERLTLTEAENVTGLENGLQYEYLEGNFPRIADMKNAAIKKAGIAEIPSLKSADLNEYIGLRFFGYIKVPADGLYRFYTYSDDASIVYVDGRQIVDNDGPHGAALTSGSIALKAGYHSYKLEYSQGGGGLVLSAGIEGPGIKFMTIPKEWFYFEKLKGR